MEQAIKYINGVKYIRYDDYLELLGRAAKLDALVERLRESSYSSVNREYQWTPDGGWPSDTRTEVMNRWI